MRMGIMCSTSLTGLIDDFDVPWMRGQLWVCAILTALVRSRDAGATHETLIISLGGMTVTRALNTYLGKEIRQVHCGAPVPLRSFRNIGIAAARSSWNLESDFSLDEMA